MIRCWRLDDERQTLVLGTAHEALAQVVYWGARLPDHEDLGTLLAAHEIDRTGGMLDATPELSLCPEASRTFPGHPGMELSRSDGQSLLPSFTFCRAEEARFSLTLDYSDAVHGLRYRAHFSLDAQTHVLTSHARLTSDEPVYLRWLAAPVMPCPQQADEMVDFSGRWCGEFQMNRTAWTAGIRLRENRTGRTGHEHFPGLLIPARGANATSGEVWAFHFGWSGGHRMVAEALPDGRRQVQFGLAPGLLLDQVTDFTTPRLYMTYSDEGVNGCAVAFQRHVRERIVTWPSPDKPRPVHYNCWEAIYFEQSLDVLKDIATLAASLGAERFVLDDGWFEGRDDDRGGLSLWEVDRRKYPQGLDPLIAHVRGEGMDFGIWIEPEMISPDAPLLRAHPDWVLGGPDQILGRHQLVLDLANPKVQSHLFGCLSRLLTAHDISYVKWDHNRVLPYPDGAQTLGTYALMDRLRSSFPQLELESCASGGGRVDFGILERTHRLWLSDTNDALERLRIQYAASIFLPLAVTGSHVGPRQCPTSGRHLDMGFRAWVAAQRHMGIEMDPRELTCAEFRRLKEVIDWWRANRTWMFRADLLRLESNDPAIIAEQHLHEDGEKFVVFAGKAATSDQIAPRPLRLTRLKATKSYRVALLNRNEAPALSRGSPLLKSHSAVFSGAYLMNNGLTLPWSFPESLWVVEGQLL